jgi:hypothetical protein
MAAAPSSAIFGEIHPGFLNDGGNCGSPFVLRFKKVMEYLEEGHCGANVLVKYTLNCVREAVLSCIVHQYCAILVVYSTSTIKSENQEPRIA